MPKNQAAHVEVEKPVEGLVLECTKDKYKLSFLALRWAKELKQKENLTEPVQLIIPRALREILTGKVSMKEIEKLPPPARVVAPPPAAEVPTLNLNIAPEPPEEPVKKGKKKDEDIEETEEDEDEEE